MVDPHGELLIKLISRCVTGPLLPAVPGANGATGDRSGVWLTGNVGGVVHVTVDAMAEEPEPIVANPAATVTNAAAMAVMERRVAIPIPPGPFQRA